MYVFVCHIYLKNQASFAIGFCMCLDIKVRFIQSFQVGMVGYAHCDNVRAQYFMSAN